MKILFQADQSLSYGINEMSKYLAFEIAAGEYTVKARQIDGHDLSVCIKGKEINIIYAEKCHFFRALGLAIQNINEGKEDFEISEKPAFRSNGPMFDVSQGGAAFNLKTMKKILCQLSLMGLNMAMIYCEDSYEVQNRPYFGYMRPRYSEADMKELDDYAYELGVEMIPCIQTLAHLPDPLRWKVFADVKDYTECLLVGEPKTYDLIRDMLISASRPFRTKKIHIGMDEAGSLGRGKYMDMFGYKPTTQIMHDHLEKVMEIINELGLEPMMWDDMFFRSYGNHKYHQPDIPVPEEVKAAVPKEMTCIYWDYYKLDKAHYDRIITKHKELSDKVAFAGGIWTWVGFSLAWEKTLRSTISALSACKDHGIKDIIATVWGDNGTECLANTTLIGCQLFAELGYHDNIDMDEFAARFKFCTGGELADFENLELLDKNPLTEPLKDPSNYNASKYLMWQDILTGLCDYNIDGYALNDHYEGLAEKFKAAIGRNGQFDNMFEFSYHVANVLAIKSEMGLRLTRAYKAGDKEALLDIAKVQLPDLKARMEKLRLVHMKNWFELYKPLGWDIMDMRYGSLFARIDSAIIEILAYLDGSLERIEELEQERLPYHGEEGSIKYLNYFGHIVSASRIAPKA